MIEVQKSTDSWGNFALSVEYRNKASILSFGYKNPTLNFVLPVLFVENPIPIIIGAAIYIVGYFYRRKSQQTVEIKMKEQDIRRDQLKLISDKANANYQKQHSLGQRGLLIEQAFVGSAQLLNQLQVQQNRGLALMRNNDFKQNVFDITIQWVKIQKRRQRSLAWILL